MRYCIIFEKSLQLALIACRAKYQNGRLLKQSLKIYHCSVCPLFLLFYLMIIVFYSHVTQETSWHHPITRQGGPSNRSIY